MQLEIAGGTGRKNPRRRRSRGIAAGVDAVRRVELLAEPVEIYDRARCESIEETRATIYSSGIIIRGRGEEGEKRNTRGVQSFSLFRKCRIVESRARAHLSSIIHRLADSIWFAFALVYRVMRLRLIALGGGIALSDTCEFANSDT